jgi:ribonucleotide reductase beta subunit family protein with ferritin-like domain
MMEKLTYLEQLKNNMGEEMAEMMSEEITKVMEEQRNIEAEYARLVHQRDQLKGITNKQRLVETKNEITVSLPSSVTVFS